METDDVPELDLVAGSEAASAAGAEPLAGNPEVGVSAGAIYAQSM